MLPRRRSGRFAHQRKMFHLLQDVVGKRMIAEHLVELGDVAQVMPEPVVYFRVVEEQHALFRLFHDRIAHVVLVYGSIRRHARFRKSVAGNEADIRIVCFEGIDGGLSYKGKRFVDTFPARADEFDTRLAEHIGGLDAAGDHDDVFEIFYVFDEVRGGGRGVEHDHVPVAYERARGARDAVFDARHIVLARGERHVFVRGAGIDDHFAVRADDQFLLFELDQVAADGRFARIQLFCKLLHADAVIVFEEFEYLLFPVCVSHSFSSRAAPAAASSVLSIIPHTVFARKRFTEELSSVGGGGAT